MTEQQYKDLLIATAKMSDYEHKDELSMLWLDF